ncbi:hypothetical protein GCM10011390_43500 [Aureimonas endophytica]|uniref:Lipoprotein n=1 Tax=Aureimonas endophytica TaxID=2027858 RepID=A0A917EAQ0_9HYPH|nr:hypothetical protein [Aureimonas endophytica]GGE19562.1 hypothetical protein GCM10011390_43500 [Aureimonas endophytica]
MGRNRSAIRHAARLGLWAAVLAASGCASREGELPPVFGAVFGLEGATRIPYRTGKIPEPVVRPVDRVLGDAANSPGQCIFVTPTGRRFRANCPEGYAIGASG